MKASFVGLISLLIAGPISAHEPELPHVLVYGTAVTEIEPDLLRLGITVSKRGVEVSAVAEQHAKDVARTLEFLRQQGILPEDTQTSRMQLSEHREYRNNHWIKEGYDASTDIAFTCKDLSIYGSLWSGLSKLNGVSIHATTWDSSKRIQVQNTTRLEALQAAKEKAEAMAAALGVEIIEPLAIEEIPMDSYDSRYSNLAGNRVMTVSGDGDDESSPIAPGAIEVRVRVRVTFRITTK